MGGARKVLFLLSGLGWPGAQLRSVRTRTVIRFPGLRTIFPPIYTVSLHWRPLSAQSLSKRARRPSTGGRRSACRAIRGMNFGDLLSGRPHATSSLAPRNARSFAILASNAVPTPEAAPSIARGPIVTTSHSQSGNAVFTVPKGKNTSNGNSVCHFRSPHYASLLLSHPRSFSA